jgi:two-component system response regulator YesN
MEVSMYKLILVDDEEEVRKGILKKIDWQRYGFEVVGEAENGREALEIGEKIIPDVVITDIKMPFMDGIELTKMIMEKFPGTKIIILTGFDEFEYAQKAVKLNVVDYVLKPISSKEFIQILEKVRSIMDEEIAEKEDIKALREMYTKSLPILREKFLASLITKQLGQDEIYEKANNYMIDLSGSTFIVATLNIDQYHYTYNPKKKKKLPKDMEILSNWEEKELMKFAVLNICDEIVKKRGLGNVFIHNEYIVVLVCSHEKHRDMVMGKINSLFQEIRVAIEKLLKLTVTIGIGTIFNDIGLAKESYDNALCALDYRLVIGNNRIIFIDDIEPKRKERIVFDEDKEHLLVSNLKVGTPMDIENTVKHLFKEIIDSQVSLNHGQIYIYEMLTTILKEARNLNIDIEQIFGENYNLFFELNRFYDLIEIQNWVTEICIKVMNFITKNRRDSYRLLVDKAKDYVNNNYHEKDITIDKMCKYLYISPTYFSSIFKRETKMTFINYLTQTRMEAAKELLRTTNFKNFEIAERVGYSEPNYFSYCFKKNLCISPTSYRKSFQNHRKLR